MGSFCASARVRYLPIATSTGRGRIGASAAYHPKAEIALRDNLSVRVGLTVAIYPEGEVNFPFGGDIESRTAVGLIWYP